MKILVTYFEPFGQRSINASENAVMALPDEIDGVKLIKLQVPTVFGKCAQTACAAAEQSGADVIIAIGEAGGRTAVTPELVGINYRYASMPDNEGNAPRDEYIIPCGEDAIFSTLPVRAMTNSIISSGISAAVSYSAGAFVCNDLLYSLLHKYKGTAVRCGFIHVPACGMPDGTMAEALSAAIKAVIAGS